MQVPKQILEDVKHSLTQAKLCHEVWWNMRDSNYPDRSRMVVVYNRYGVFFETVRTAFYVTFIIKLASVFDDDPNAISLNKLNNEIARSPSGPYRCHNVKLSKLCNRGERLHKYRNKAIAHRDKEIFTKDFAQETGFTYDDLKAILDDACVFLDGAADHLGLFGLPKFSSAKDFERLVADLSTLRVGDG